MVLTAVGMPLDLAGPGTRVFVIDLVAVATFASCWLLNGRGHRTASRIVLGFVANAVVLDGVLEVGAVAELRAVFFPLVILPFLVFDRAERLWVIVFTAIPVACYFLTWAFQQAPAPGAPSAIYVCYAPALAFTAIAAGTYVFVHVERNAEDAVQAAQARAAQGARLAALGEMSSGIAHEIRNPLAAINLAAAQIAERPGEATLVAELGARIQRIVTRASRIIDALRSFTRDASGDPFLPTPVDRIIQDAVDLCGKRFADHGVTLTVGAVPANLVVECRSVQLSQVLVNLLGNAWDAVATATDRWVQIDVHTEGDRLELAVTDSGPGVPADARARIFEPFFTTKSPDRGTGLGLSLSRNLVEAHRGTLTLDPDSPHTRFVIRVPRTQPRARPD
jgi:signal transduction histidine kinase